MYKRKFEEVDMDDNINHTSIQEIVLKYHLYTQDSVKQITNTRLQRFITNNFTKNEISQAIKDYKPPTNIPNRYLMLKNFISDDKFGGQYKTTYRNQPWEFMLPGLIKLFKIIHENEIDIYKLESVCNDKYWKLNFTGSSDKDIIANLISEINTVTFDDSKSNDEGVVNFNFPVEGTNMMAKNIIDILNINIDMNTEPITPIHYLFLLSWANVNEDSPDAFKNASSSDMCQDFFNFYYDKIEYLLQNPSCEQFANYRKLDQIFHIDTKKCMFPDFTYPMVRNFSMDMLVENCIHCNDIHSKVCLYCYGGNIAKLSEFDWTLFEIFWQNEDEYKKNKTDTMRAYQLFLQTLDEAIYDTFSASKITKKFLQDNYDAIVSFTNNDNKEMSNYLLKILSRHYNDLVGNYS